MPSLPAPAVRRRFRRNLLSWYRQYGRSLPWRTTDDPYHILVSEIMLQQTQVDRVLPKYGEWLEKYPSFEALAAAEIEDVSDTWRPLGYNIRPRRLHSIAREAVANYGGRLPSDAETLLSFKGIGEYTAGAIRSFAFRQRAAILDTNVARVLYRVFVGKGDPKSHAMKKELWRLSEAMIPRRDVFDFNQALMDFGALLCVARKPKCLICPMKDFCVAYPFTPNDTNTKAAKNAEATKNTKAILATKSTKNAGGTVATKSTKDTDRTVATKSAKDTDRTLATKGTKGSPAGGTKDSEAMLATKGTKSAKANAGSGATKSAKKTRVRGRVD